MNTDEHTVTLPKLVSLQAFAAALGDTPPETVRSWARQGLLTRVRVVGRTYLLASELAEIIEAGTTPRTRRINVATSPGVVA